MAPCAWPPVWPAAGLAVLERLLLLVAVLWGAATATAVALRR